MESENCEKSVNYAEMSDGEYFKKKLLKPFNWPPSVVQNECDKECDDGTNNKQEVYRFMKLTKDEEKSLSQRWQEEDMQRPPMSHPPLPKEIDTRKLLDISTELMGTKSDPMPDTPKPVLNKIMVIHLAFGQDAVDFKKGMAEIFDNMPDTCGVMLLEATNSTMANTSIEIIDLK